MVTADLFNCIENFTNFDIIILESWVFWLSFLIFFVAYNSRFRLNIIKQTLFKTDHIPVYWSHFSMNHLTLINWCIVHIRLDLTYTWTVRNSPFQIIFYNNLKKLMTLAWYLFRKLVLCKWLFPDQEWFLNSDQPGLSARVYYFPSVKQD